MTRLLASVTSVEEAKMALDGGADIIDLKNPHEGALGALPLEIIHDVVRFIDGRRPVSATIGNLPMDPELVCERVMETAATGVDIVKIGIFGQDGHAECIRALEPSTANGVRIVAVMFADTLPRFDLLSVMSESGFYGAMIDTNEKRGRGLLGWLSEEELSRFVTMAKRLGLLTGLAGSLALTDIPKLVPLLPDYLGFRGGLCAGSNRKSGLNPEKLKAIYDMLHICNNMAAEPA